MNSYRFWRRTAVYLAGITLSFLVVSCGGGQPREITERRALSEGDREVRLDATASERFGFDRAPSGHGGGPVANPFRWENPDGWEEVPPTSMRVANFKFGEGGEGECYVTAMPGAGGGTVANINRWRGQMGLEPMADEEVATLPVKELLGSPAPYADFTGTFTGMAGPMAAGPAEPKENYRMLGVILTHEMFTLFVKMTGPADVVEKEQQRFDEFCRSLRIVSPGGPAD